MGVPKGLFSILKREKKRKDVKYELLVRPPPPLLQKGGEHDEEEKNDDRAPRDVVHGPRARRARRRSRFRAVENAVELDDPGMLTMKTRWKTKEEEEMEKAREEGDEESGR